MRRAGALVALGALLGLLGGVVTASPALARGDGWQFLPAAPETLGPSFCGFPVHVAPTADKQFGKLLKTSGGSMTMLVTGTLKASLTNLNTGKTITENGSGPAKVTTNRDGSATVRAKGLAFMALPPADAQRFDLPTLSVTAGALTFSLDPNGNITSLSLHGHVLVDVCAALS